MGNQFSQEGGVSVPDENTPPPGKILFWGSVVQLTLEVNMDVYSTVTDRILKQLEAGVIPWRKTWTTGLPVSLTSKREYRGIRSFP